LRCVYFSLFLPPRMKFFSLHFHSDFGSPWPPFPGLSSYLSSTIASQRSLRLSLLPQPVIWVTFFFVFPPPAGKGWKFFFFSPFPKTDLLGRLFPGRRFFSPVGATTGFPSSCSGNTPPWGAKSSFFPFFPVRNLESFFPFQVLKDSRIRPLQARRRGTRPFSLPFDLLPVRPSPMTISAFPFSPLLQT